MIEYEFECTQSNKIYAIKVGESAQDNWDIIEAADNSDIWFHVNDIPSCHVVLEADGMLLSKIHVAVLKYCAALCKAGSKRANFKAVTVIYTEIRNVRIDKKGAVGSVFTAKTQKLVV